MSKLISGKEALIALANGEEVEVRHPHDKWYENWESLNGSGGKFFLLYLLDESTGYQFRLKPRTITLNGIEVPAPFEPKNGEDFYYLDCTSDNYGGWAKTSWRNVESDAFKNNTVFGAWRTEEEVKQVVAALRCVFGGES